MSDMNNIYDKLDKKYIDVKSISQNSITATDFFEETNFFNFNQREEKILHYITLGNIPSHLLELVPITISDNKNSVTYYTMKDYLSLGSDTDYCRIPMNPITAQIICNKFNCSLPTKLMVNQIWKNSSIKLSPSTWGPPYDSSMYSSERYKAHNQIINDQLKPDDKDKLISGHKKDVVLTNYLYPNNHNQRVAIYGWIQKNGVPIQGLNAATHEISYADYSHGIRLIYNEVYHNNESKLLKDIFSDPNLASLISHEGVLKFLNY